MTNPWIPVLARIVAGFGGGYLLSAVVAVLLARTLPAARLDAVLTGAMVGFVVHVLAIVWAFAARTATRACLGIFIPVAAIGGLLQLIP